MLLPGVHRLVQGALVINIFVFSDGREVHDTNPRERPQIEIVREKHYDYLSYASGNCYTERFFGLTDVHLPDDVAIYRELVS